MSRGQAGPAASKPNAPQGSASQSADSPLERLFASIDTNHDGSVDVDEVKAALEKMGLPAGASYINTLLQQYDRDGTQTIEIEEFRRYVESKEERMRSIFSKLDTDGDGQLEAGEVHRAAAALGLSVAAGEAEHMVALLDSDGDGRLSFEEFQRFAVLLPSAQVSHTRVLAAWIDSTSWLDSMEYQLGHVPSTQPLERLLAGGVSGAVSRTVVAPLERLRTIMMADRNATRLGPVLRSMWADGGVRGLFRGNLATVVKVFPSSAIQFAVFDACKDMLVHLAGPGAEDLGPGSKLGAGLLSGAAACMLTYPLEALRTQVAVSQGMSAGYLSIVRATVAERGLRGLFQGFPTALVNQSMGACLGFGSYEMLCTGYSEWSGGPPSPGEKGLLGGAAGFLSTAAVMPLENVTRRLQAQGRPGFPRRYSGGLDCAGQMLRQEGIRSFWRGSLSSLAKVVPSMAATRLLYESIVEGWGIGGVRRYRTGG